ncbi:MAG: glycoside hydrolase family 78 protein [Bifidobacteriaceae bacterium]|jgi:alpha-L-rhamnosidase|nr:glycoside hydrolase family 78 protein [Bifidobacteriaceae bacterium]
MSQLPGFDRTTDAVRVAALSTQFSGALIGLPLEPVRLTWSLDGQAGTQLGHQIAWRKDQDDEWRVEAVTLGRRAIGVVAPPGPLTAREVRQYKVRVAFADGWTQWSAPVLAEGGLGAQDWRAQLISIASEFEGPAPLLRHEFDLPAGVRRARLYAPAQGFYEVWINGRRANDEYMNPGWTPYDRRLLAQCWDVTELLQVGANGIGLVLGDGWFRGRLGGAGRHDVYGGRLAGLVQLEIDLAGAAAATVVSDAGWRGGFGAVRSTSLYGGTVADLRLTGEEFSRAGFDDSSWPTVSIVATDTGLLTPRPGPGVRVVAELPMELTRLDDRVMLDSGQNLAGWVKLTVRGRTGDQVTIRHAEVLDPDGTLHTRSLRRARPVDTYVLGHDGISELEPTHTYHGFRHCDVVGKPEVLSGLARAVSCDLAPRSSFACSDQALNQFHANALWSLRSNFMSVPTDCPQRDERLGWTGDAAAFAATANTLVNAAPFWDSWLRDLALEQREDGSVPSTVPNVFEPGELVMDGILADPWGRSGWADAVTLIPAAIYESYGDPAVLAQNLQPMRGWVEHLRRRAGEAIVVPDEPFQWGDWLDPDAPGTRPWESKVTPQFVANAFYVRSARLLAAAEALVGDPARATVYSSVGDQVAAESWRRWRDDAYRTQTGAALALEYEIAPQRERRLVAEGLAASVAAFEGRIATGFVGARLVLFALARSGHVHEAYQMLLRHDPPSWLYQVDRGATTVWERWDAIKPDGSIHTGAMDTVSDDVMVSFNHYAYGAVVDWMYRFIAGLEPMWDRPGYQGVAVQPRPAAGVTWARASIRAGIGEVAIDWRIDSRGDLVIDLSVPTGAAAWLNLPVTDQSTVRLEGAAAPEWLTAGRHRLCVTAPAVA